MPYKQGRNAFSTTALRNSTASSNAQTNQNQGGGEKKAGFPYMIGRGWRTNIAFGTDSNPAIRCCGLKSYQTMTWTANAKPSRPISSRPAVGGYYHNAHY